MPDLTRTWPGKIIDGAFHPALWHMFDVGAVAQRLIEFEPVTGDRAHDQALAMLIMLHDLGKFSEAFRNQITGASARSEYHTQLGFELLAIHDDRLAAAIGGTSGVRRELTAAVAGHHGGPPEVDGGQGHSTPRWRDAIGPDATEAAGQVIDLVADLFPAASLDGLSPQQAAALSWKLSGLTIQADWTGSNQDWFPAEAPEIPVKDYWEATRAKARVAIAAAGLNQARPSVDGQILDRSLRPMQAAVQDADLPEGPVMALIEDATGAGKTEAALILATRMMRAQKARGLFFALPTMATSNAMFTRLEVVAPRLFDGRPSLGLSHGRAKQNEAFSLILGRDGSDPGAQVTCGQWLADDRRLILLADIGVGTVDQALLAVLATRFNTLRLWALSGRVLIVDEAHSYDPYMDEILCHLLYFHALLGGSAIVMTATLPKQSRQRFVSAFQAGLGLRRPPVLQGDAYPQLSMIGASTQVHAPAPVPSTCREIEVRRLSPDAALRLISEGCKAGAACVWIRNAVDDAINAVAQLRAAGVPADLLHARFTGEDRLAREDALQARFGKDGAIGDRAGRVLVATQVVEASLDLDFDLMVSDLAPVGSLIQRAGRLWRHMDRRPLDLRPVEGPCLHVVSPDPDEVHSENWLLDVLPRGGWVYPVAEQWRTARAVFDAGVIRAPDGLRALIEAVHGEQPEPVPALLEQAEARRNIEEVYERGDAKNRVLKPKGYLNGAQKVLDEDRVLTRLGRPQVTLWLAREDGGGLRPYGETWIGSEVKLSRSMFEKSGGIDQETPAIAALKAGWPEWKRNTIVVAPVSEGGRISEGLRYDRNLGLVR
ncbi:MAG: CRISPR-associated helicase Cas3' [Pseudomonadota bacterium]